MTGLGILLMLQFENTVVLTSTAVTTNINMKKHGLASQRGTKHETKKCNDEEHTHNSTTSTTINGKYLYTQTHTPPFVIIRPPRAYLEGDSRGGRVNRTEGSSLKESRVADP